MIDFDDNDDVDDEEYSLKRKETLAGKILTLFCNRCNFIQI